MKKEEVNDQYAILYKPTRNLLESQLTTFEILNVIKGNVVISEEDDEVVFVEDLTKVEYLILDELIDISFAIDEIALAHNIITANELQEKYPNLTLEDSLESYFNENAVKATVLIYTGADDIVTVKDFSDDELEQICNGKINTVTEEKPLKYPEKKPYIIIDEPEEYTKKRFNSKDEIKKVIEKELNQLDKLVGLQEIKEYVNKLILIVTYNHLYSDMSDEEIEIDLLKINNNCLLIGNPGTGKTTIANILSNIMTKLGYTHNQGVTKVLPSSFLGKYEGFSETQTNEIFAKNRGKVLIIDEAYAFNSDKKTFYTNVLNMIIKEMEIDKNADIEELRNKVTFFFIGYQKEMEEFLKMNSGLRSRLNTTLSFRNFTEEEILQVIINSIKKQNESFEITEPVIEKIKLVINKSIQNKDFGNARFAENMADKILLQHKQNIVEKYQKENYQITLEDLPDSIENELGTTKVKTIGF